MKWYVESIIYDNKEPKLTIMSEEKVPENYKAATSDKSYFEEHKDYDLYADVFDTAGAALKFVTGDC